MDLQHNNLANTLKNFIFHFVLFSFILSLLYNFTVYGQLQYRNIYSSSRNDLPGYNDVRSTYDGSLSVMLKDNDNQYKSIHTLLPNGSTIDIDLKFLRKNVTRIFPLTMQYYFLLYDQNFDGSMQVTGIVLDYNKKILKDNLFVANGTTNKYNGITLNLIMDTQLSSFLIYNINKALVYWITYNLPQISDPNIYATNYGNFNLDTFSFKTVFPMIDGNYGFIIENQEHMTILNESMTNIFIYYKYLNSKTSKISENSLLYHARNVSEISNISCSSDYSEYGNVCMITEPTEKFANYTLFMIYQINFLSSGSVIKFTTIKNNTNNNDLYFDIHPSFFGGSIVTSWTSTPQTRTKIPSVIPISPSNNYADMTGSVIMLNGTEITWSLTQLNQFNQSKSVFQGAVFDLMKNNTYILYVRYSANEWDIFSMDLPKSRNDRGYDNPNIISTYPKINDNTIIPESIHNINIIFSSNISMSLNNITIYQLDTSNNQLNFRKFYSGNSDCYISFSRNLSCSVTSSIFNQWNTTYVIVMDNNFVMFSATNEPMYGIEAYRWNFTTIPCDSKSNKELYSGTIRLTLKDNIKNDSLSEIFGNVTRELVESIPINPPNRLQYTNRYQYQYDSSTSLPQYTIQLKILPTQDPCQASTSQIINNLNELINDTNSLIYKNNYTKYLNSSYGFRVNINFWDDIKFKLLGLLIGSIILGLVILCASRKYPEGQNFMIFSAAIILLDLVMDILFIVKNGKEVSQLDLYIPSKSPNPSQYPPPQHENLNTKLVIGIIISTLVGILSLMLLLYK
ncbi:4925_t:CDS:2, partial [Dentiscutata heterogama]